MFLEPVYPPLRERQRHIIVIGKVLIGLLHQLLGVRANQLSGEQHAAVVLVFDPLVQRSLELRGSAGAVASFGQVAVLGRLINLVTVIEYAAHRRLIREQVEAKFIFGSPGKSGLLRILTSDLAEVVPSDEALLIAQRQSLRHERALYQRR